ncbi:MAG: diacylglycerol kinase family protein [Pseudomonadota bacterium]|nr:diacylglycerol kinase family protein [Pseudomonadota bacterium]
MLKRTDQPILTNTHVVINARSGRREGADITDALERCIHQQGGHVTFHIDERGGAVEKMTKRALKAGASTVIAAGGDGTICGVANQMVGTGVPLGVLPLGTFNYFARSLGIPENTDEAVEAICDGTVRPAAVGRVNDQVFLNNTSIGVYSAILQQREDTYKQFGRSRIAAYWSVLRALVKFYDPMTMKIEVDGERLSIKSPLAFVCNSAYQLERFALQGADEVRDGKLALFLADDVGRFGLVKHAAKLATRRMREGRDFRLVTGKEIVIDPGRRKRLVVRDGEKEPMRGPYRIRIDAHGLDVIRPRGDTVPA